MFRYLLQYQIQGRIQVVGVIKQNLISSTIIGYLIYSHTKNCLYCVTPEDLIDIAYSDTTAENATNFVIEYNHICITDGATEKLPIYDIHCKPLANNLPVILNRVMYNEEVLGYTIIDNGVYNRFKTEDLLKRYTQFYNARVCNTKSTKYISAKNGSFQTIDLSNFSKLPEFNFKVDGSIRYAKVIGQPVIIATNGNKALEKWAKENGFQTA